MNCIFCKIIKGEIPSTTVFEDKNIIAFKDINPVAPVHILVVPKVHFASLIDAKKTQGKLLGQMLIRVAEIAKKLGIDKNGYKIVINNGKDAGQIVFHLHMHLIGGWKKEAEGFKI